VQEISIVSGKPPTVHHPDNGRFVYLTFEGLRESRTVVDKLTRVRVTVPIAQAAELRDLLTGQLQNG
jgi:hypothetical protein